MTTTLTATIVGAVLGVVMVIGGGLIPPPTPACPGCAVLVQPPPSSHTCYPMTVQGGWVCT